MEHQQLEIEKYSKFFKFSLGIIVVLGVIMVYSASYMFAKEKFGSSTHFFFRQLLFLLVSVGVAFVVAKSKFRFWLKFSFHINLIASFFISLWLVLMCSYLAPLGIML